MSQQQFGWQPHNYYNPAPIQHPNTQRYFRQQPTFRDNYRSTHPSSILCRFYGSMKGCRAGTSCPFSHRNPNSIPFCFNADNCLYGNQCHFRHQQFDNNHNDPQDIDTEESSEDLNENDSIFMGLGFKPLNVSPPKYMQYELLIKGFYRNIENIPEDIYEVIRIFFRNFNMIIYNAKISENNNKTEMFLKNIEINGKEGDMVEFDLDLSEEQKLKMEFNHSGMCFVENIKIPSKMQTLGSTEYNAIFKCGGERIGIQMTENQDNPTTACCVWLFDRFNLNTKILHKETIKTQYYELPELMGIDMNSGFYRYSRKYGLVYVGRKGLFNLQIMNQDGINEWRKWDNVKVNSFDCGVLIDGNDQKERLIGGCGGQNYTDFEMFNFENKEWTKLKSNKQSRYFAAMCHNEITKEIYLGGGKYRNGYKETNTGVECYDITKNMWWSLPKSRHGNEYQSNPVIMCDINMLYIAGSFSHQIEYIDLRTSKCWMIYDFWTENKNYSNNIGCLDFAHRTIYGFIV